MFVLNEKVVYPGHGVAEISCIVEKVVGGSITKFLTLKFFNKEMTILVPMESAVEVGIRKLSSRKNISDVMRILSEPTGVCCENNSVNWNKRNKEYQCKLRSGNIYEIGKIYRDLKYIAAKKELSFGEKSLLSKTESLLVEEIAIVTDEGEEKTIQHLRSMFA